MGVITIEIPQKIKKKYQIRSIAKAQKILDSLDRPESGEEKLRESKSTENNGTDVQGADDLESALNSVVGMWSYREESAEDIAKNLRARSNRRDAR